MAAVTSTTTIDSSGHTHQEVSPALLNVLDDYAIHQSPLADATETPDGPIIIAGTRQQRQPSAFDPTLAAHPRVARPTPNPSWWEGTYRRVPEYRPVNHELDPAERMQNPVFRFVGTFMVLGCMTMAVSFCVSVQ